MIDWVLSFSWQQLLIGYLLCGLGWTLTVALLETWFGQFDNDFLEVLLNWLTWPVWLAAGVGRFVGAILKAIF